MSSKLLEFCPNCQALMTAQSNDDYTLKYACKICRTERRPEDSQKILKSTSMKHELGREKLNASMIYDAALRKTARIKCPKGDCPSHDISRWGGAIPETGIIVQPQVSVTNFTSKDRVAEYICNICRTTFKVDTMSPA